MWGFCDKLRLRRLVQFAYGPRQRQSAERRHAPWVRARLQFDLGSFSVRGRQAVIRRVAPGAWRKIYFADRRLYCSQTQQRQTR